MPVTPSQLRRPILVDSIVDFGNDTSVTFRFDRNRITDAWLRDWSRYEDEGNVTAINDALADLIHGWDIVGDDGNDYLPTAEHIGYLFNLPDKARIVELMMKSAVPSSAEGNASPVPTSTPPTDSTVQDVTPPNGTVTSPLPVPSASPSLT